MLTRTDPLGRRTTYAYAADNTTLTSVRQTTGGLNDLLATYGSFTAYQQPQTVTDAALRDAIALRPGDVRGLSQSQRDRLFANALALPNYRARPDLDLSADGRC